MGFTDFDFEAFKAQKIAEYKKNEIKPATVKKASAGIVFVDYKMAGKKVPCVFIPFRKVAEAMFVFKAIKKDKEHLLKKTGLVTAAFTKADEGGNIITLDIKKGGLTADILKSKGTDFFKSILKVQLEVIGASQSAAPEETEVQEETTEETSSAEETSTGDEASTDEDASSKSLSPAQKEKIKENVSKIGEQLEKIAKALKIEL